MRKLLAVSFTLAALACVAPMVAALADSDSSSSESHHQWREARAALFEARLVGFKAGLALTADEEKNWPAFETALRDIAKARMEWRHHDSNSDDDRPSPIDRMRRISDRLGERSTELKQLADAAAPLYASLDDKQKLVFRATLRDLAREGRHGRRHHDG
jgi:hypothetical protein